MSAPDPRPASATASTDRPADPDRHGEIDRAPARPLLVALLGNPNTGKTTLFNRLTGLRHKTSNFPGTTLEARTGRLTLSTGAPAVMLDLPGAYSLELDQLESRVAREALAGRAGPAAAGGWREPDALCVVVDATNLGRNLRLVGEALRRRLPTVVAVNMIDLARNRGLAIDPQRLAHDLGCPVALICARSGEGLDALRAALAAAPIPTPKPPPPGDDDQLTAWAQEIYAAAASRADSADPSRPAHDFHATLTDRLDRVVTHPVMGLAVFVAIMAGLFYAIFTLAQWPMEVISAGVALLAESIRGVMPPGLLTDLLTGGVLDGVGTVLVFLPQICILFFLISLLEDTGYLARGAFLMDRLLRPFGLPGHAFVPLLSSHACALPGIIACRAVPDPRERLATILVAPFMSCSARLPVYALLTGILFPGSPGRAALAFIGCYALGIIAGVLSALVARRTILRGKARPMALELPSYKRPSLRTAAIGTWDRAIVFVRSAGTNILAICVVLWWLGAFPTLPEPARLDEVRRESAAVAPADPDRAAALDAQEQSLTLAHAREAKRQSYLGRLGHAVQPVFAPLGADWQLTVGVIASFAAREVFAGTMAVVITGDEDAEAEGVLDQIASGTRDDGSPIFTPATSWALLVYYVLAMQCLPTLVVTARESGGWKWAALQFAWMSGLAYVAGAIVYALAS